MPPTEFEIINRYFSKGFPQRNDVLLGIGDDAALCQVPPNMQLAISMDTLVEGVHFLPQTLPQDIGYKALAVNLSDMAAMGATPAWITLALTCPTNDEAWLAAFRSGLLELAQMTQVSLIGGDTTRGPLTVTIQIAGFVPSSEALQRHGAQVDDGIYVTGYLGDAGLGLASAQGQVKLPSSSRYYVESRLNRPTPRISEGQALRGIANSAIDISDGLLSDLGHLLTAGGLGASLYLEHLPLSKTLQDHLTITEAWNFALSAGDDYELCFTVPPHREKALEKVLNKENYTRIGTVENHQKLCCWLPDGGEFFPKNLGYQHWVSTC